MSGVAALAPGVLGWSAAHPDWRPHPVGEGGGWGPDVWSYALEVDGALVLVDPLLPPEGSGRDAVLARLDAAAERATGVVALRTISFHTRSIPALVARYGASRDVPAGVEELPFGDPLDDRGYHVPSLAAVVVGDLLLGGDAIAGDPAPGPLRLCPAGWLDDEPEPQRWHAEDARDVVARLAALGPRHVLVTHGSPVIGNGAAALGDLLGG